MLKSIKNMRTILIIISIFLVSCDKNGINQNQTTGFNYYECKFMMQKSASGKINVEDSSEICNQLHPARNATPEERSAIDIVIRKDKGAIESYRHLKIGNQNKDFLITEVEVEFNNGFIKVIKKFTAQVKPRDIDWSEWVDTGITGDSKTLVKNIKGRIYK